MSETRPLHHWCLNLLATKPADLKAALEAKRDEWIRTTPQVTDEDISKLDEMILDQHNEKRAPIVALRATTIAKHNAEKLDAVHTAIVGQMNKAISVVTAGWGAGTVPCRVSVAGHYKTVERFGILPDGTYTRYTIHVDEEVDMSAGATAAVNASRPAGPAEVVGRLGR